MESILLDKALNLPPKERVAFAELILASIDKESPDVRQAWITEVKDRIAAVKKGTAKLMDFEKLYDES